MNRSFEDWLYRPSFEESVCVNPFHETVWQVFQGRAPSLFDPYAPDDGHIYTKLAKLLNAGLILLEGDVIYVKENTSLHPLNEAIDLLAYYMHTDSKEARKAADVLETNFQGYFPITDNKVWRNGICLMYSDNRRVFVDLKTLEVVTVPPGLPEFGMHIVADDNFIPLAQYFSLINEAVEDPWFFEKTLMYPFNQPIREKSQVLVGEGGNGKSLFMLMVQRLYGGRSLTDAPQPNFKGHDPAVIAYNFIGKRVVTFNDVGDPSVAFLEWLKRMITGKLEVKTPSGSWMTVPCVTNFLLESNHRPELLDIEAHQRRFVIREFNPGFKLNKHMSEEELDVVGERGNITAGDIVNYLLQIKPEVQDWKTFEKKHYDWMSNDPPF